MLFGDQRRRVQRQIRQNNLHLNYAQRVMHEIRMQAAAEEAKFQSAQTDRVLGKATKLAAAAAAITGVSLSKSRDTEQTPDRKRPKEDGISPPQKRMRGTRQDDEVTPMELEFESSEDSNDSIASTKSAGKGMMLQAAGKANPTPPNGGMAHGKQALGNGETPIDYWMTPHYGLPDTTTVIIPYTTYFSAFTNSNQNAYNFYVRLNSIVDPMITVSTSATPSAAIGPGVFRQKWVDADNQQWSASPENFPLTQSGTEVPQWKAFYFKLYDYWAVLGMEWEMTIQNPQAKVDRDVVMFWGVESTSSTNNVRTFPGNIPISNYEFYPGLNWKVIRSESNASGFGKNIVKIGGRYKPGTVQRNVQNDEDVKTWTKTDGSTPTLTERMMFGIGQAAFNDGSAVRGLNIKLDMKFIVQFKDLHPSLYYPYNGATPLTTLFPNDILNSA